MIIIISWHQPPIRYWIENSPIDRSFQQQVREILQMSKWHKYHNFYETDKRHLADIKIFLKSPDELKHLYTHKKYYPNGKEIQFSFTVQSKTKPPVIYINSKNWLNGVPESGLTLRQYREYVINHEFGHALSYDHQPCKHTSRCPVMYQSTIGCPTGIQCGYQPSAIDLTKKISNAYFN